MSPCIYHLVDTSCFAGIESSLVNHCELLQAEKINVKCIFFKYYPSNPLYRKLDKLNIEYQFIENFMNLLTFIKKLDTSDVLHTHGYKAGILGRTLSKLLNKTCVSTYHAGEQGSGKLKLYNDIDKYTAFMSTNFVVSNKLKPQLNGSSSLFNNFVLPKAFIDKKSQAITRVSFIGRLSSEKGPDIFIQLASHFKNNNKLVFNLFGDGPERHKLEKNLPNNCHIRGFTSDMDKVWHNSDILVISSREEGLPMVAIEAMMSGVLVVSTKVGQLDKLITSHKTGYLAEQISALALADCISEWLRLDNCIQQDMIRNAYKLVLKEYSGQNQAKQLKQAYCLA